MPRYSTASNAVLPSYDEILGSPQRLATRSARGPTWARPIRAGAPARSSSTRTTPTSCMRAAWPVECWKSTDAGASWTHDDRPADGQPRGGVAGLRSRRTRTSSTPARAKASFNGDAVRGAGIFKSTDDGRRRGTQLAVHQQRELLLHDGPGGEHAEHASASSRPRAPGVYRSKDGGATWTNLIGRNGRERLHRPGPAAQRRQRLRVRLVRHLRRRARSIGPPTTTRRPFTSVLETRRSGRAAPSPSRRRTESVLYVMSAQRTNGGGHGADSLHGMYRSTASGDPGSFTTQVDGTAAPADDPQTLNRQLADQSR